MLSDDRDRALWASVVLQARDDVAELPIGSADYASAVSFLTGEAAYWRAARTDIANHIGLHGDDIKRVGLKWVLARRQTEGLPDQEPPPARCEQPEPVPQPAKREPLVIPPLLREALWARQRRAPAVKPQYAHLRLDQVDLEAIRAAS